MSESTPRFDPSALTEMQTRRVQCLIAARLLFPYAPNEFVLGAARWLQRGQR